MNVNPVGQHEATAQSSSSLDLGSQTSVLETVAVQSLWRGRAESDLMLTSPNHGTVSSRMPIYPKNAVDVPESISKHQAYSYIQEGKYGEAMDVALNTFHSCKSSDRHALIAFCKMKQGNYKEAILAASCVLGSLDQDFNLRAWMYDIVVFCKMEQGKYQEAMHDAKACLALGPLNADIYGRMYAAIFTCLVKQGMYDQALSEVTVALNPTRSPLQERAIVAIDACKMHDAAIKTLTADLARELAETVSSHFATSEKRREA